METNDQQTIEVTGTGDPILDLQNLINSNLVTYPSTSALLFPVWCDASALNLGTLQVSKHDFDFMEYRDVDGNVLLRHTLGAL